MLTTQPQPTAPITITLADVTDEAMEIHGRMVESQAQLRNDAKNLETLAKIVADLVVPADEEQAKREAIAVWRETVKLMERALAALDGKKPNECPCPICQGAKE